MPDDVTLAYLAGVIDSDGYITVHRSVRAGKPYFAARVGVTGTRRQPHDLAASLWGGSVSGYRPRNQRHRIQYQWSRTGVPAMEPIEAVFPYLRIKRDQALLALEVQELVMCGRGDDPWPWMGPDYDPLPYLNECRNDVVELFNQDRRAARRVEASA